MGQFVQESDLIFDSLKPLVIPELDFLQCKDLIGLLLLYFDDTSESTSASVVDVPIEFIFIGVLGIRNFCH